MVNKADAGRALVVFAHPVPGSFTEAIRERVFAGLQRGEVSVDRIDLYDDGFAPVMSASEVAGSDQNEDAVLAGYMRRVGDASMLVLVYPTWWGAQPAIMKGWFDRMLSFRAGAKSFRSIRRIVVVTPHGSSRFRNALQGAPGRHLAFRHLRSKCHRLARCTWVALYNNDQIDDSARARFLDEVEERLFEVVSKRPRTLRSAFRRRS